MKLNTNIDNIKNYDGIPSVTGILSLLDLETLDYIKYMPNYKTIMNEAVDRGNYIHKYIEEDLNGKQPIVVDKYRDYIKQWLIYKHSMNREYKIITETVIKTEDCGGTLDLLEEYSEKEYDFVDWKTSSNNNINIELLEKYKIQLGGYAYILEESGFKYYKGKIVIFTPNKINIIELDYNELYLYKNKFLNILYFYNKVKNGEDLPEEFYGYKVNKGKDKTTTTTTTTTQGIIYPNVDSLFQQIETDIDPILEENIPF